MTRDGDSSKSCGVQARVSACGTVSCWGYCHRSIQLLLESFPVSRVYAQVQAVFSELYLAIPGENKSCTSVMMPWKYNQSPSNSDKVFHWALIPPKTRQTKLKCFGFYPASKQWVQYLKAASNLPCCCQEERREQRILKFGLENKAWS